MATNECLFCRSAGPFTTTEHIVPESLGNDSDVLVDVVCDDCQRYLGREVEKPALEKSIFGVWRTLLGIRTKKNRRPTIQLDPRPGGRLPKHHQMAERGVGMTANTDGSVSLDLDNDDYVRGILAGDRTDYKMILTPWHLSIISRLLGKMGLEYVASHSRSRAMTPGFDPVRDYVRRGATHFVWPVYWAQRGDLRDLRTRTRVGGADEWEETITCYRFALGESTAGEHVFAFQVGTDIMVLCLSHRRIEPKFEKLIEGVRLRCVHYPDHSW